MSQEGRQTLTDFIEKERTEHGSVSFKILGSDATLKYVRMNKSYHFLSLECNLHNMQEYKQGDEPRELCKQIFTQVNQFSFAFKRLRGESRYIHIAVDKNHAFLMAFDLDGSKISFQLHKSSMTEQGIIKTMMGVYSLLDDWISGEMEYALEYSKHEEPVRHWIVQRRIDHTVAFLSGSHKRLGRYSALSHLPEHLLENIYVKSEEITTFELFTFLKDWLNSKDHQPASSSSMAELCCAICNKMIVNVPEPR
jgi:hypothetical protein